MVKIALTETKTPPKSASGAPKTSQRRPQNARKTIFGSKKRANEAQGSSRTNLEALFGRSRGPKEPAIDPQELPKGAQGSPKTLSIPSLDLKRCCFKTVKTPEGKSRFLRVGGSIWEFKIDLKRLRKEIKNDIERRRQKLDEKKTINNAKKSFKKL